MSAKRLNVAFLWHMHQPCYVDAITGETTLPWVRLHAIKAYYDMPLVAEEFPELKVTINLVPSLIEQVDNYTERNKRDLFFDYSAKPASELTLDERVFLLRYFFSSNWQTMVHPHKEYHSLLIKRGSNLDKEALTKITKRFTSQNFLDLQCWFNLSWFGFKALERKKGLSELIAKGKNFSEDDKKFILDTQIEVMKEIPSIYKRLFNENRVELSMSPYFHPILPILCDSESARRAMPDVTLPPRIHLPEDADAQITKGLELFKNTFGRAPKGMWPSEGSVSPEALEVIRRSGIEWIATDEEVLAASNGGIKSRDELYKPYLCSTSSGDINLFFRDKNLSNFISFTYHRQPSDVSVANFIDYIDQIRKDSTSDDPTLSVILDGENPWEYYLDKGAGFLRGIYKEISTNPRFKGTSFSEISQNTNTKGRIETIHSGSWINHNFDVWIGKPNTNRAWELLKRTRDLFLSTIEGKNIGEDRLKEAWKEIYTAEGSDWFWWFSDYFYSDNAEEFDRLFRSHLMKVYNLIEVGIPWQLQVPVASFKYANPPTKPKGLVTPVLDGKVTNYYEWANAGAYEIQKMGSFMYEGKKFINSIHYGFDLTNLYIRIDPINPGKENNLAGVTFNIDIVTSKYYRLNFNYSKETQSFTILESADRLNYMPAGQINTIGIDNVMELSIPFSSIEANPKDMVRLFVWLKSGDIELIRYPRSNYLTFEVPTQDFEDSEWMV